MIFRFVSFLLGATILIASRGNDSVVVFNELMYNNSQGDSLEWIEIYNQMAVDVELSGWTIEGADFVFPTNTILGGKKYLVIANLPDELKQRSNISNVIGPLTSKLANEGERLRLKNHNGRIMDQVTYGQNDPWPPGADGSGFSLAKIHPDRGSREAANWRVSSQPGGSPGVENFPSPIPKPSILFSEVAPNTASPFWIELANTTTSTVNLADWQIQSAGSVSGNFLFGPTAVLDPGKRLVVDQLELSFRPKSGDRIFLLGPNKTSLHDAVVVGNKLLGRSPEHDNRWLVGSTPTPGEPNKFEINSDIVINEIMYHDRPLPPQTALYEDQVLVPMTGTWRYQQGANAPPSNWADPAFNADSWPQGPALLYVETDPLPAPLGTALQLGPMTFYFRSDFEFTASTNGAELFLEHVIDDSAIIYLNGKEIFRFNLEGPVNHTTPATTSVPNAVLIGPIALPPDQLRQGKNVIAAEVHQGSSGSTDIVFGCKVGIRKLVRPARGYSESTNQWIELLNKGNAAVDLSGWTLGDKNVFTFPAGTILNPGGYLVVAQDTTAFLAVYPGVPVLGNFPFRLSGKSEWIRLRDLASNPVDEVRYFDDHPWPAMADGLGASLELHDPRTDNRRAEAWSGSIEAGAWREYTYTLTAQPDNGPTRWNEFVFGLLDAGEVLLDDFSVVEQPTSAPKELLQNGKFDNGLAAWRFLGTHRQAKVITDPDDPSNKVLHLLVDGPTEHMHNHVESTYIGNQPIQNGRTYKISFRAKWLMGCNKINTRLYFNRAARTTDIYVLEKRGTPGRQNSSYTSNAGPTFSLLSHFPVVPTSAQSVTISTACQDPDGVKASRLWYSVNGGTWTTAAMTLNSEGIYTATLPARAAATVVQFYIEAEDQLGAIAYYPAGGKSSRALYRVNDSQGVSARLHNLRILMLPAEATALHTATNVMSNGRSGCTIIYNEREIFYDAGLHLQSSQRGRMADNRVGFTIRFPADHLFRGVQDSVTMDRSGGWSGKGGAQDEIVLRHIMNQAGRLPDMYNDLVRGLTPLSTHTGTAMLIMAKHGDEYFEGIRDGMGDGGLFKLELIYYPTTSYANDPQRPKIPQPDEVMGVDIGNLGNEPEAYRWFFLNENHQARDDYSRMIELAQAFSLTGSALEQKAGELMDVSQWARVFAAKSLGGDADTYGFGLTHNQLIFFDPAGKSLTMPWDMDFAWYRAPNDSINVGWRIGSILNLPPYRRLYFGHLRDILDSVFSTSYMTRWTTHYGSMAGQNYSGVLTYIGQRASSARSQLPVPAAFRVTTNNGQPFETNKNVVILRGQAPYTYERLEITGQPGATFSWSEFQTWETTANLEPGVNSIAIVGYDFRGQAMATNTITITANIPQVDSDNDGMPDGWERDYGLQVGVADANSDVDKDGLANIQEYIAGTNPNDNSSLLRLSVQDMNSEIEMSFLAKAGRKYLIQHRADLSAPWIDLVRIPAKTADEPVSFQQEFKQVSAFYRLIIEP